MLQRGGREKSCPTGPGLRKTALSEDESLIGPQVACKASAARLSRELPIPMGGNVQDDAQLGSSFWRLLVPLVSTECVMTFS